VCGLGVVKPNYQRVPTSSDPRALFGKYLRELRLERQLSQEELADRAHFIEIILAGSSVESATSANHIVELASCSVSKAGRAALKLLGSRHRTDYTF